jgi:ethanolamine ammonia-lyase small subunit
METITIRVDAEIAKAYREAAPEKQQKIATIVNDWLKSIIQEKSLEQIITEMQEQAKANGLTQDILNQILADDIELT